MTQREKILLQLSEKKNVNIEFALIDDIAKMNNKSMAVLKNGDNAWKSYQDYLTKADVPFKRMINAYDSVTKVDSDSRALASKVESMAKEIGVSPSSIKGYDALNSNANVAKEIWKTIASFKDPSTFQ